MQIVHTPKPLAAAANHCAGRSDILCLTAHNGDAVALRQHLAAAGKRFLLPPIVTLPQLTAAAHCLDGDPASAQLADIARLITPSATVAHRQLTMTIYALLREQMHQKDAAVLSLAAALATLLEKFVEEYPTLLIPAAAIPQLCEKMGEGYRLEARVMSALWNILYHGRLLASRRALAAFARHAPPLVYVGSVGSRRPWHADFLRQGAGGGIVFEPEADNAAALYDILSGAPGKLSTGITDCRQGEENATLSDATKTALSIARDFTADNQSVGIVVYDRLLARRLRAFAETEGLHIQDDGGWRMETLSFGAALRQWAEATVGDFSPGVFAHLLSPPYWPDYHKRERAEQSWRKLLAEGTALPQKWADFNGFADREFFPLANLLIASRQRLPDNAPLSTWIARLLEESAAALSLWADDPAAVRLRAALYLSASGSDSPLTAAAFCAWLQLFMGGETGGDNATESRVHFVPPTTTRRFDALLLLGAQAETLPPPPDSFWGEAGRRQLNLQSRGDYIEHQLAQFSQLLAAHRKIAAVWRGVDKTGRQIPASPFWTLLTDKLREEGGMGAVIAAPPDSTLAAARQPLPAAVNVRRWPGTISITAGGRLMQCPYHFFAKDILRLREDDGTETLGDAARGLLLHRAMKNFITAAGDSTDPETLLACWRKAFTGQPGLRTGAAFFLHHWSLQGEQFVREEAARRAAGWRPQLLEHGVQAILQLPGGTLQLRGRLDRADSNGDEWAVIDYKSGRGPSKQQLQNGEDPQLALYAFLLGQPAAGWRICYPTKGETTATTGNARRIAGRLRAVLRQIARGATLPANGAAADCARCTSRRLCRRDHWQEAKQPVKPFFIPSR